jgi:hypothetical protein
VDGRDDLLGGVPLQVGAGRREVRVPQLALDQREWDALMQQLDSVGVSQLMRCEAPADSGLDRCPVQLEPSSGF